MSGHHFCAQCGAAMEPDAQYCGMCGAPVAAQPARGPAATPATPAPAAKSGRRRFGGPLLMVLAGAVLAVVAIAFLAAETDNGQSKTGLARPDSTQTAGSAGGAQTAGVKPAAGDFGWKPYMNSRYGVSVDYPSSLFTPGEAPPDNAGRNFTAADGARFFVYSSANALDEDLTTLLGQALEGISPDAVLRKDMAPDGFTLVVRREGEIVLRRLTTSEQGTMLHWLEIGFPPALKDRYEPIAERMLSTFKISTDPTTADRQTEAPAGIRTTPARPATQAGENPATAIDLPVTAWIYNAPGEGYADLPALIAETDQLTDNRIGQLTFVCQAAAVSPAYFAMLVAPSFRSGDAAEVKIAIEGAGAQGTLSLPMRDLYATKGGERPDIDWDATILFAPVAMEDLGAFVQAEALIVSAGGANWRLAGGISLKLAGEKFLAACEGGDSPESNLPGGERGPDEFSYRHVNSADFGFAVENARGPAGFSVDIPEGWVRVPNTLEHELIFASPDDDPDAQMFLAIRAEPAQGRTATQALAEQIAEMQSMTETEILEQGAANTAFAPGRRALLRFFSPQDTPGKMMDELVVLSRGELIYRLELTVPEPVWHTGRQVMARALASMAPAR